MERRQDGHDHVPKLVHRKNKFFAGVRIPHVPEEQTPRVGLTFPPWERVTTSMLKVSAAPALVAVHHCFCMFSHPAQCRFCFC